MYHIPAHLNVAHPAGQFVPFTAERAKYAHPDHVNIQHWISGATRALAVTPGFALSITLDVLDGLDAPEFLPGGSCICVLCHGRHPSLVQREG